MKGIFLVLKEFVEFLWYKKWLWIGIVLILTFFLVMNFWWIDLLGLSPFIYALF